MSPSLLSVPVSDDNPCENGAVIQRFLDCLCLHYQAEIISETLDYNAILTWLITQEDYTALSRRESFKSHINHK
jgi:hypothetical protein